MATVAEVLGVHVVRVPSVDVRNMLMREIMAYRGNSSIACGNAEAAKNLADGISTLEEFLEKGQNPTEVLQVLRNNWKSFVLPDN